VRHAVNVAAQEHLRVDIKWDILLCEGNKDNCDNSERAKIAKEINAYIAGIQENIAWCHRFERVATPEEQRDLPKTIKNYEADLAWAKEQLTKVASNVREACAALVHSPAPICDPTSVGKGGETRGIGPSPSAVT
jgi:hypothetical protein